MKDYVNFTVSRDVMDAMISAAKVSTELVEPEISTLDFLIASFTFPDTALYKYLEDRAIAEFLDPQVLIRAIMGNESAYENLVGQNYEQFLAMKKQMVQQINVAIRDYQQKDVANLTTFNLDFDAYLVYDDVLEEALTKAQQIDSAKGRGCVQLDTLIFCILCNRNSKANLLLNQFFKVKTVVKDLKEALDLNQKLLAAPKQLPEELQAFVTNMNDKYLNKDGCDILERDEEIFQVWNIMSKKTKRNAILVGDPGVGKSAIVEAITYSIVKRTCPKQFEDYTVYSLDLTGMVAGTKYRGEFEEKTQQLVKFLEGTDRVIIFLDEIHHLLGAGSAQGSGPDLSGALKPLLARDNVVFIGATTTDEYNRIFARDGALSRRFEMVVIKEPKLDKVTKMIDARVKNLSDFHKVQVSEEMLDTVLVNATSFSDICNPDRTIDLLDKSMAVAKMLGDKELKMNHVKQVYKRHFEKYKKMPVQQKRLTAYHEAGHFAAWYLSKTKRNQDCVLVSIIPADNWLGVNIFESIGYQKHSRTFAFLKEEVAISLAGRIAQSFISDELDSGASSDLRKATSTVEKFLMDFGIDESFLNYSFSTGSKLNISDKTSDEIRAKAKEIINEVYASTEKQLKKHKDSIDNLAKLLMKKGIVTKKEAIEAFIANTQLATSATKNKVKEAN